MNCKKCNTYLHVVDTSEGLKVYCKTCETFNEETGYKITPDPSDSLYWLIVATDEEPLPQEPEYGHCIECGHLLEVSRLVREASTLELFLKIGAESLNNPEYKETIELSDIYCPVCCEWGDGTGWQILDADKDSEDFYRLVRFVDMEIPF